MVVPPPPLHHTPVYFPPAPPQPFIAQGVSLTGLGSFAVGQCVDTLSGGVATKRAPVFVLHEKFSAVPQNKGRYFLKAPATYVRVNSLALASQCKIHKSAVTYVLKEILAAIATRLKEGKAIDIDFTFARLTNVSGRVELSFNQSFLNDFGIAAEEMPPNTRGRFLATGSPQRQLTKKITGTTPSMETEAAERAAAACPFKADAGPAASAPGAAATPAAVAVVPAGNKKKKTAAKPAVIAEPSTGTSPIGNKFLALCGKQDRLGSGSIDRLVVERVLNNECNELIADLPAKIVFDALKTNAGGRMGRFVYYLPLLRTLEAAAEEASDLKLPKSAWGDEPTAPEAAKAKAAEEEKAKAEAAAAAAAAKAAEAAAAAAEKLKISEVVSEPVEPGAPIADLFQSFGAGSRGVPRLQLAAFNRQYAGAVRDYNRHSAGEVTPKVTNNRAMELSFRAGITSNPMGKFLQTQIDSKEAAKRAEIESLRVFDNQQIDAARAAMAAEAEADKARAAKMATELRASWDRQLSERANLKKELARKGQAWPYGPEHVMPRTPLL